MRITVIGTGYLGATHAACLAELGFEVLGVDVDVDAERIATLAAGRAPFHEPGLDTLLEKHCASGGLRFTTDVTAAAAWGEVHFLCVGTPQAADGSADLTALESVVDRVVPALTRDALLVGKSTVPVGTARRLRDRARTLAPPGVGIDLAWNPEFLREGHGVADTLRPDRLVVGTDDAGGSDLLRLVYADPLAAGVPLVTTDLETAELCKVAANAFLATKISFVNAMAELCDASGADVVDLARVLGLDDRIGPRFLAAGLGFGGGCLPKDLRALVSRGEELGRPEAVSFLRGVDAINLRRRTLLVDEVVGLLGTLPGRPIGVLGASFKPGSDDVRDSPALAVARELRARGAFVTVHDPHAQASARAVAPELRYAADPLVACRRADVVLHLTEWPQYAALDPAEVGEVVAGRTVVDGRLTLDAERWRRAGWRVVAPGRPQRSRVTSRSTNISDATPPEKMPTSGATSV